MKISGAKILIESLIEQGVDTIFGYPGASVLNIYEELRKCKNRIRHILVSHEQHAAHAADGYARSSGRVGVCLATSGPGATNLVTGIAAAFVDSVPIVAITGNVGTSLLGKDSFQEVDIAGITMPIVKHNWIVEDVNDLAEIVREAFIVAKSGRPGPVLIDIPKDISTAVCEYQESGVKGQGSEFNGQRTERLIERTRRETFGHKEIDGAISLIKESRRPMIYAGGGVIRSGADAELKKFAELLNAPVALSLMGMGAIAHEHPLCTGLIGMYGSAASGKALQKTDLLIALGARFSDRVINGKEKFAKGMKIIHIDIDPAEINKNAAADAFIVGDLKTVLNRLIKKLPADFSAQWGSDIVNWKVENINRNGKKPPRENYLQPRFIIQETAKALGDDAIVVTDVGQHQIWTAQFYPFKKAGSFLSSGGLGAMGYCLGAAAGAKIANPKTPVIAFTGDGSFRMNCAELATLVKHKLPVLIILLNNSTLGMLRQWQNLLYKAAYYETDLDSNCPDFIKLADAYGVQGFRVKDEVSFTQALGSSMKIIASGKPVVIEAVIDINEKVI